MLKTIQTNHFSSLQGKNNGINQISSFQTSCFLRRWVKLEIPVFISYYFLNPITA